MKRTAFAASLLLWVAGIAVAQEKRHPYDIAKEKIDAQLKVWQTQFAGDEDVRVFDYVLADRKAKRVTILACATSITPEEAVEFFVTPTQSGKDYESLLLTYAKPSDVHKALEFIGLKPGRPVNYETNHHWPRGPRVRMTFEVNGKQVPAEDLIYLPEEKKTRNRTGMVFTGSYTYTDDAGKQHYAADVSESRTIAPNFNDPIAVLDVPERAMQGEVYGFQRPNPDYALNAGQIVPITLAPMEGEEAVALRDIVVKTTLRDGLVQYALFEGEKELTPAGSLAALVEAISKQVDGRSDLFTTVTLDPAMLVTDVRKLFGVLMAVEKDRGVKLDPTPDAFFHRAYFPDEEWRVREDRLGEPWELFLDRVDGKLTGKLERVIDNPEGGEPKQIVQSYPAESPDAVLKLISENQSQWTKAIFVYPPADLTYGEALRWLKPTLEICPRVFFFTPAPPATQPAS